MISRARTAGLRLFSISCIWEYGWIGWALVWRKEDLVVEESGAFMAGVDTCVKSVLPVGFVYSISK